MMGDKKTEYIPLHEAAKLTDYSQEYISLLCRRGKMKGKKLGRNWFTTREWINDYVNKINKNKENQNVSDTAILRQAQDDNDERNIIPVKIEKENVDRFNEVKSENKTPVDSFLSTKKMMLATIIFSVIVSGFVFIRYGMRQDLALGVLDSVSQSVQNKIISLNGSLNSVKNESSKFSGNKILAFNNSLNKFKNSVGDNARNFENPFPLRNAD